ncbi:MULTISPECIES: patatin-like phospholipase family protein [unclassified Xanthobacter]|uniref:patatin-like phospholipase family protein n=1 Tax=unclassified Xanthobacter TaxID=2623496 RepID=UPI001EE06DA8|nr:MULTISPECIES: patatin-like phospholipase family protein [unclassified Xanthobacter]
MSSNPRTRPLPADLCDIVNSYERIALVFQGGGALGAYQAGVYEALAEAGCEPNWISGVSIGAINSALIAGNTPENRVPRLQEFWDTIAGHTKSTMSWAPEGDIFRQLRNQMSAAMTIMRGQPGFFRPRVPNPWLLPAGASGATSFYDTSPLRDTLLKLVDFDLINSRQKRFSVGAVNVRTGNFIYFDNSEHVIGPEHIMASGALPPGFPAVKIEGEYYWDGGVVSNTPLQFLLDQPDHPSALVFQVDLFSARGPLPRDMYDVTERQKDIGYSSRTRYTTDVFRRVQDLRGKLFEALQRIPEQLRSEEDRALIDDYASSGPVNICHLIYQEKSYEREFKDYEFSHDSMRDHWQTGYEDTVRTLQRKEWLKKPDDIGIVVHDIHRLND